MYFGQQQGTVYAITDSGTAGVAKWSTPLASSVVTTPAAVSATGTLYVGTSSTVTTSGALVALNASTGAVLWSTPTGAGSNTSPAIAPDGVVYVVTADSTVYALDGVTGVVKWQFALAVGSPAPHSGIAMAVVGGQRTLFVVTSDNVLHAVTAGSSTVAALWTVPYPATVTTVVTATVWPAVDRNGVVYVVSYDGVLHAVTGSSGVDVWSMPVAVGTPRLPSVAIASDGTTWVAAGGNACPLLAIRTY